MFGIHVAAAAQAARRALPLGLAAILLASALGATVPARAQDAQNDPNAPAPTRVVRDHRGEDGPRWTTPRTPDPDALPPIIRDHRDPYARILLVIKKIGIHNDMDWGEGEFGFSIRVDVLDDTCMATVNVNCANALVQGGLAGFSGWAGKVKELDRVVPAYGDTINDRAIAPPYGIPIREGARYGFTIKGTESDPTHDDRLGILRVPFTDEAGQVRFGTHTQRAYGPCVDRPPFGVDFCPPDSPNNPRGGFEIEYEIRRAHMPDLRIGGLQIHDVPGSATKLVCPGIVNSELGDAGPFEVVLHVDGGPVVAKATAGGLAAGTGGPLCIDTVLPAGQHELTIVVDEADAVLEFNEQNNSYSRTLVIAGVAPEPAPGPSASPTPGPILIQSPGQGKEQGQGQADLTISAIRVNGRVPDGKDDCKDGKNSVTVVVKNAGTASAGPFVVRLDADGDTAGDASEAGLEAGKEREVRFGDVKLKKGEHELAATADAKGAAAESQEENNERTVSLRCQNDD